MPASILRQSPRKLTRTPSKPSRLTPIDQSISLDKTINQSADQANTQLIDQSTKPHDVPADKKSICLALLTEGYIHSYTDFFYLTHKQETTDQSTNQSTNQSKSKQSKEKSDASSIPPLSSADLITISTSLREAEQADREADSLTIIDCFTKLSKFFKNRREFRSAIYFSEKILEFTSNIGNDTPTTPANNQSINQSSQLQIESLSALTMLAELFAECGESSQSIAMYEKCSTLASDPKLNASINQSTNPSLSATLSSAANQLTSAYCQHGDRLFTQNLFDEAVVFYEKCTSKAQQANQSTSEMIAYFALGVTHTNRASNKQSVNQSTNQTDLRLTSPNIRSPTNTSVPSTPQASNHPSTKQSVSQSIIDAMSCFQKGLSIAKQLHHSAMIAEFSLALADNYILQQEQNLALNYLELAVYHAGHAMEKQSTSPSTVSTNPYPNAPSQILSRSTDFARLFRGWQCMGEIHSRAQNHVQASEMFEKSFELARKHANQSMMDLARIHVGMARANVAMKTYMTLCQGDIQDVLEFKAKRIWPETLQPPKTAV